MEKKIKKLCDLWLIRLYTENLKKSMYNLVEESITILMNTNCQFPKSMETVDTRAITK